MRAFLINADASDEETVVTRLWERRTAGMEERASEPGRVTFLAYFGEDAADLDGLFADRPTVRVEPAEIPDVDWVARFRENFRGFSLGGFSVAPAWDVPRSASVGGRLLVVEPGRAFGTGTHESTALCLAALERISARFALGRTLDVGTGSGILSVAAMKLGATLAVAADIDPESIEAAARHARLNGTGLALVRADGGRAFREGAFDTVVANITAPLLIERAGELGLLPRPGGRLILAGLLADECPSVASAYSTFGTVEDETRGEWAALVVTRR